MSENLGPKKGMTEEERLALAAKLDKELDDFIESLPKRQQPEGGPDENWLEEFDRHPFFMKKAPEPGEPLHPLYEGLQQLKYDPNENSPQELAKSYKEDGNFNFKHKNYRLAILAYTEGIKVKCPDDELQASLYNNRAAANFYLKNYRSCIKDCELALKLKPNYLKTLIRAANSSFNIGKFDKAVAFCDQVLEQQKENKEILALRQKSIKAEKELQRDLRKKEAAARKKLKEETCVIDEIVKRNVKIEEQRKGCSLKLEMLEPKFPELSNHRVFLSPEGFLVWPVVFLYPQYQIMDFVQQFPENDLLFDQIGNVFCEYADWDENREYTPDNLNVYYENSEKTKAFKVDVGKTLREILQMESFVLRAGTPSFILLVKDSVAEKKFLQEYKK